MDGALLVEIPEPFSRYREIQSFEFVRKKAVSAAPGGGLAIKSLACHRNACIDLDSEDLVSIRIIRKSNSTALKEVTRDIKIHDAISKEC